MVTQGAKGFILFDIDKEQDLLDARWSQMQGLYLFVILYFLGWLVPPRCSRPQPFSERGQTHCWTLSRLHTNVFIVQMSFYIQIPFNWHCDDPDSLANKDTPLTSRLKANTTQTVQNRKSWSANAKPLSPVGGVWNESRTADTLHKIGFIRNSQERQPSWLLKSLRIWDVTVS